MFLDEDNGTKLLTTDENTTLCSTVWCIYSANYKGLEFFKQILFEFFFLNDTKFKIIMQ